MTIAYSIKENVSSRIEYRLRLETIAHQQNPTTYYGKVLDLKDELQDVREAYHKARENEYCEVLPGSVEIEEYANSEGRLESIIEESTWLESLNRLTGKDFRIIHDYNKDLFPTLGLYEVKLTGVERGKVKLYKVRLWIVPVAQDDEEDEVTL